jgi:hypothetical protein
MHAYRLAELMCGRFCGLPIVGIRHPSLDVLGTGGRGKCGRADSIG